MKIVKNVIKFIKKIFGEPEELAELPKKELIRRINEFLKRATAELPDSAYHWDLEEFKNFLAEPFLVLDYEEYDEKKYSVTE